MKSPKSYVSLYFSCTHIEGKENTRIYKISPKVMYPCIFLAFYMSVRKVQGFITFQKNFQKCQKLKTYESLYFSCSHIESKRNTLIHNFSDIFWGFWLFLVIRKVQGFITFQFCFCTEYENLYILVHSCFLGNYKDI